MAHVVGIDGGGSKTVGLLGDVSGEVLARVEGGAANYHQVGLEGLARTLRAVLDGLSAAVPGGLSIAGAVLGLAGVGRREDAARVLPLLGEMGFPPRTLLTHDARIALAAGAQEDSGIILVAGTGSIAYGRTAEGGEARAGGFGPLLGDEGSGYDLAVGALRAVVRAADGRAPMTALSGVLLGELGLDDASGLVRWVESAERSRIASLAPLVFEVAAAGDAAAQSAVAQGADALADMALSVHRRLTWAKSPVVVLDGGLFRHQNLYCEAVRARIRESADGVAVLVAEREPAEGALWLAREWVRRDER
jgi:N-acetylglucosamine kinase-like BadF-type ATPase